MHPLLGPATGSPPARFPWQLPPDEPAVVVTGDLVVVDSNRRWRSLHSPFADLGDAGRMVFCDPAAATFFIDRRHEEHDVVAFLLDAVGEAAARAAVHRLRQESPRFDRLWAGARVRPRMRDTYAVRHPALGTLTFDRRTTRRDGLLVRIATPRPAAAHLLPLLDHLPG